MKKIALLALIPALVGLSGCGSTGNATTPPYRVSLTSLGYSATGTDTRVYTIPQVTANVVSSAGAPDIRTLTYTAVLLNPSGEKAIVNNPQIAPLSGLLFANAKGGYVCPSTVSEVSCNMLVAGSAFADNGSWAANTVSRSIVPIEWAVAHDTASNTLNPAGWSVDFTFTALQANGNSLSWRQNYQFVSPAGN